MKIILILLCIITYSTFSLNIKGEFNGWTGETVVELSDGSFWIQSHFYFNFCYSFNPIVKLVNENGSTKMYINGCGDEGFSVRPISNVIKSRIDGEFKGWDGETIFKLKNGTIWKQKNYSYWYKYANNPECTVFNNNGWKLAIFDKVIDVVQVSGNDISYNNDNSNNYQYNNLVPTVLKVQNNTENTIYYCYSAKSSLNGWEAIGWFKVDPYSYTTNNIGYYTGYIYLYAEANFGEKTWHDPNSNYYICVDKQNAFSIPNADISNCNADGFKKVQVSEFYLNPGIFTWNINP